MNTNFILIKLAKFSKNLVEKSTLIGLIFALTWQFALPKLTSLAAYSPEEAVNQTIQGLIDELGKPLRTITVPVTAYNSLPAQTDDTPCLTANDFDLCKNNQQNVIAANFLPFGTKVRFPNYDPNTIYTVVDRMNARYTYRADIWMKTKGDALAFGIRNLKMEIYSD